MLPTLAVQIHHQRRYEEELEVVSQVPHPTNTLVSHPPGVQIVDEQEVAPPIGETLVGLRHIVSIQEVGAFTQPGEYAIPEHHDEDHRDDQS